MAKEETEGKKAKATRRSSGPKPVYVLYKPNITEDGKVEALALTRNAGRAMKFLSDNPGAKVEERLVA